MGVAASAANPAFVFGDDGDAPALEHPGTRRNIEQRIGDHLGIEDHQIGLLADGEAVSVREADSTRRIAGAHLENVGLMFRGAELNEMREKIADLERVGLAERRESVADIVRRIGDIDAGCVQARVPGSARGAD